MSAHASTRPLHRSAHWRLGFALLQPACAGAAMAGAETFELRGTVIAGGGGSSRSAQGCFALDGTIAETAAGVSNGGEFAARAGFWGGAGSHRRDSVFRDPFEECR